jgi:hypothetical protein
MRYIHAALSHHFCQVAIAELVGDVPLTQRMMIVRLKWDKRLLESDNLI